MEGERHGESKEEKESLPPFRLTYLASVPTHLHHPKKVKREREGDGGERKARKRFGARLFRGVSNLGRKKLPGREDKKVPISACVLFYLLYSTLAESHFSTLNKKRRVISSDERDYRAFDQTPFSPFKI